MQPPSRPSCSVVVATRDRQNELDRCLGAVMALDYPDLDVIVIDSAPSHAGSRAVASRWGARYFVEPAPGLSRARNLGLRVARGEIVAFVDDDAVPEPGWLSGLVSELQDPRVAAVTGRVTALDTGRTGERALAAMAGAEAAGSKRRVVDRQTPGWFELTNFGGIGDGGNMAFRRIALDSWQGFDVRLGRGAPLGGGEEHHAFFSLVERGAAVAYTPDAVVRHPYPRTASALRADVAARLALVTAYTLFLLVEEPAYRGRTLRYAAQGVWRKRRAWRGSAIRTGREVLPKTGQIRAGLAGVAIYLRARTQARRLPPERREGALGAG